MATFRKRLKGWRAEVYVKGIRDSGTFDTKSQAMAWAVDRERQLKSGPENVDSKATVKNIFELYAKEITPTKRSPKQELLRLNTFCEDKLASVKLADINASHVANWRDRRLKLVKPSSVNRELNIISNAFEVARREWKWISENPCKDVTRPKNPPPRDRLISNKEIKLIRISLDYPEDVTPTKQIHFAALAFLFAIETAMRAGEICGIYEKHIDGPVAHLPKTKNGASRNVPLSKRAIEILSILPDTNDAVFNMTASQLDGTFRKGRNRSGIDDLKFHDTRHEGITRLAKKLDVLELARMVGHKDLKMLLIYYNETAANLAGKLD